MSCFSCCHSTERPFNGNTAWIPPVDSTPESPVQTQPMAHQHPVYEAESLRSDSETVELGNGSDSTIDLDSVTPDMSPEPEKQPVARITSFPGIPSEMVSILETAGKIDPVMQKILYDQAIEAQKYRRMHSC